MLFDYFKNVMNYFVKIIDQYPYLLPIFSYIFETDI